MRRLTVKRPDGELVATVVLSGRGTGPVFTIDKDGVLYYGRLDESPVMPPYVLEAEDTEAAQGGGLSGATGGRG